MAKVGRESVFRKGYGGAFVVFERRSISEEERMFEHDTGSEIKVPNLRESTGNSNDLFAENAPQHISEPSKNVGYALTKETSKYR